MRKIMGALAEISRRRGVGHLCRFIVYDVLGNQLGLPVDGHKKELLFWEKQAVGLGNFSGNFAIKVDRARQAEIFPHHLLPLFETLREAWGGRPAPVLDVGAGPVSLLTWAHHQGLITLTACDFLSDQYQTLLAAYGHQDSVAGVRVVTAPGERLLDHLGGARFGLVYCNNALDHMDRPDLVLRLMVEAATPGGYVVVSGRSREGTFENWDGIHNHDLFLQDAKLMRCGRRGEATDLGAGLPIEVTDAIEPPDRHGTMLIVYRKRPQAAARS